MKCLSLLHCFSSGVSPRRMYGNISISWWMYFSSRSLVWGTIFSCAVYVGGYSLLWIEESCVGDSMSDVYVGFLSWYTSVVSVILMGVVDLELGLGCLYSLFTYLYDILID